MSDVLLRNCFLSVQCNCYHLFKIILKILSTIMYCKVQQNSFQRQEPHPGRPVGLSRTWSWKAAEVADLGEGPGDAAETLQPPRVGASFGTMGWVFKSLLVFIFFDKLRFCCQCADFMAPRHKHLFLAKNHVVWTYILLFFSLVYHCC